MLGQDAEVQRRVSAYDVMDHLLLLSPGQMPTATDSLALVNVANSPSGYAPVACSLLRYFYPQVSCNAGGGGSSNTSNAQARATNPARKAAGRSVQLQAYPNPATEQVTLEFTRLGQQQARLQLIDVSTGRLMREQQVSAGNTRVTFASEQLPSGVYAARLLGTNGEVLSTAKLVVIH